MNAFNCKFILNSISVGSGKNKFNFTATLVDNSGNFFASNAKVNDIIYINTSSLGRILSRFSLTKITSSEGNVLEGEMTWDLNDECFEIHEGLEGFISERLSDVGISELPNVSGSGCDEVLITVARNYEMFLLTCKMKDSNYPTVGYVEK